MKSEFKRISDYELNPIDAIRVIIKLKLFCYVHTSESEILHQSINPCENSTVVEINTGEKIRVNPYCLEKLLFNNDAKVTTNDLALPESYASKELDFPFMQFNAEISDEGYYYKTSPSSFNVNELLIDHQTKEIITRFISEEERKTLFLINSKEFVSIDIWDEHSFQYHTHTFNREQAYILKFLYKEGSLKTTEEIILELKKEGIPHSSMQVSSIFQKIDYKLFIETKKSVQGRYIYKSKINSSNSRFN
jgi:hypothetical protein